MEQFEVGDRVRLKSIAALTALPTYEGHDISRNEYVFSAGTINSGMCRHFGDLLTVGHIELDPNGEYFSDKEFGYSWCHEWFELVASAKLNGILRAEEEIVEQIWGNLR